MSTLRSTFPDEIWDGTAPTLLSPLDNKTDFQISDQHSAEIRSMQAYMLAYVEILRQLGLPNTVLGVNQSGTALEYKEFVEGDNITIDYSTGHIRISSTGSGGGPSEPTVNTAETDSDVTAGQPLYIKSNTHVDLASSDDGAAAKVAGLAIADAVASVSVDYVTDGQLTLEDWTAVIGTTLLTPGADYYLTVDGTLSVSAPTNGFITRVGRAIDTTTFDIEISSPIGL